MRSRLGHLLRTWGDRIDRPGAPKYMGYAFTFEEHRGVVFREGTSRGCPLWYYGDADYERAHAEAGSARPGPVIACEHGSYQGQPCPHCAGITFSPGVPAEVRATLLSEKREKLW